MTVGGSPPPKEDLPGESAGSSWGSNDLLVINANNSPTFSSKAPSAPGPPLAGPTPWSRELSATLPALDVFKEGSKAALVPLC